MPFDIDQFHPILIMLPFDVGTIFMIFPRRVSTYVPYTEDVHMTDLSRVLDVRQGNFNLSKYILDITW